MKKEKKEERPDWYSSDYRGRYDFDKGKTIVRHKKPLRCPYCGHIMNFASPVFYEYSPHRDWYWFCMNCGLRLPNKEDFSKDDLAKARKHWRNYLKKEMNVAKAKYLKLKNLYNQFGQYFTPKEKRETLVEAIEEQEPQKSLE